MRSMTMRLAPTLTVSACDVAAAVIMACLDVTMGIGARGTGSASAPVMEDSAMLGAMVWATAKVGVSSA